LITREVYVVDVSSATNGFLDERRAHIEIDDLLRVARPGSSVRLVVGKVAPLFSTAELTPPPPYWTELLRNHAVQIEGDARTVRTWMVALEGLA